MLFEFLQRNEDELVTRCRAKVAVRRVPRATDLELEHGIPIFLKQLISTLETRLNKTSPPMVSSATKHGDEMLHMGFTVEQVIRDYGDLCQAITELAVERDATISAEEFGTLNRCLDDAIAGAVTEFSRPRQRPTDVEGSTETNLWLGTVANEVNALLRSALVSFDAIKRGSVAVNGSTSGAHERALRDLQQIMDHSLIQMRLSAGMRHERIGVAELVAEVVHSMTLDAEMSAIELTVAPISNSLAVYADRRVLSTVLATLLQNAFKFTRANGRRDVSLTVRSTGSNLSIEVQDECGGLPTRMAEELFWPFPQRVSDRHGSGLALALLRRAIEANGGTLRAQNQPLRGCAFTVELPSRALSIEEFGRHTPDAHPIPAPRPEVEGETTWGPAAGRKTPPASRI